MDNEKLVSAKYYGGKNGMFVILPEDNDDKTISVLDGLVCVGSQCKSPVNRKSLSRFATLSECLKGLDNQLE